MKKLIISEKWIKRLKRTIIIGVSLILAVILCANYTVVHTTGEFVYQDVSSVPRNKAGLLLGTSKLLQSGLPNQYFQNRIQAAEDLFKAGRIDVIVISGDNSRKGYNEPKDIKDELVQRGIPENKIYLDYAGFRTLDSIVRMEKIFGQKSFTVISQKFHNERAIYIARAKGLQAIGYNAEDVDAYSGFKTQLREKLARVKLFLDLWTGKKPKFLGEPVIIN